MKPGQRCSYFLTGAEKIISKTAKELAEMKKKVIGNIQIVHLCYETTTLNVPPHPSPIGGWMDW